MSTGRCRATVTQMEDTVKLKRQIERCRRIASWMTDDEVRHSLEQLADRYEAELQGKDDAFMLRRSESRPQYRQYRRPD